MIEAVFDEQLEPIGWLRVCSIARLNDEELAKRLHTEGRTLAQRRRLSVLKEQAPNSIGCQFSSVEFEGQNVVKLVKEMRQAMAEPRSRSERCARNSKSIAIS
jgi:hypothetical protein